MVVLYRIRPVPSCPGRCAVVPTGRRMASVAYMSNVTDGVVVPSPMRLFQLFTTNLLVPIVSPPANVEVAVDVVAVKYEASTYEEKRPAPVTSSG